MRALILANSEKEHFVREGQCVPTCFLPTHGELTIIERIFSLLCVSKFAKEDICACFGIGGIWEDSRIKQAIDNLHVKTIYANGVGILNKKVFDDPFFENDDLLIVDGTEFIDLAIFTRLLRYRERNVIVVRDLLCPDDAERLVSCDEDLVTEIADSKTAKYPWTGYAGVCKLSKEFVKVLNEKLVLPLPLLDALSMTLDSQELKAVNYDDLGYGIIRRGHSNELIGGSYSKLNYRLVVRKEANGNGREKLINEINWLLSLPDDLKPYFSSVLEYDATSPMVYYNIPYYGSRNLREYIFAGNFNSDDAIAFLDRLLRWMFKNVYSRKISDAPTDWVIQRHVNRVLDRLPECCEKSDVLKKLINANRLIINGVEYRNVKELYNIILKDKEFLKRVNPKELVMIHGDLHFQNILLSSETDTGFILVDPRGEHMGADLYYDIGKLLHSFHAKYDFIHSDQFKLKIDVDKEIPVADFEFTNSYMVKVYDDIYEKFLKMMPLFDYFKNDPDWMMKAYFAEASHLCSVMTFHIAKSSTPDRISTLYLTGVILINEFFERFINMTLSQTDK